MISGFHTLFLFHDFAVNLVVGKVTFFLIFPAERLNRQLQLLKILIIDLFALDHLVQRGQRFLISVAPDKRGVQRNLFRMREKRIRQQTQDPIVFLRMGENIQQRRTVFLRSASVFLQDALLDAFGIFA